MSIIQIAKNDGTKGYIYKKPSQEFLYSDIEKLLEVLGDFVKSTANSKNTKLRYNIKDIKTDWVKLSEVMVRVDKRRDYFSIYHKNMKINEIKETALLCYWILKFHPFYITTSDDKQRDKYRDFNELFACWLLYSVLKQKCVQDSEHMRYYVSEDFRKLMFYAFKYWDLSKESLILIAESLCEGMRIHS